MFKEGDEVRLNPKVSEEEFAKIGIDSNDGYWDWFFRGELEVMGIYAKSGDLSVRPLGGMVNGRESHSSARIDDHMVLPKYTKDEVRDELMSIMRELKLKEVYGV